MRYLLFVNKESHFEFDDFEKFCEILKKIWDERGVDFQESMSYYYTRHVEIEEFHRKGLDFVQRCEIDFSGDLEDLLMRGAITTAKLKEILI